MVEQGEVRAATGEEGAEKHGRASGPNAAREVSRTGGARAAAIGLGVVLTLVAVFLYFAAWRAEPPAVSARRAAVPDAASQQAQASLDGPKQQVLKNPRDGQSWAALARTYAGQGRKQDAASAYANAVALLPRDAALLTEYANLLALMQGARLDGEPVRLVRQALEADPKNAKALAMAGGHAFENGDPAAAIAYWRRLLALIPPESDLARRTGEGIKQAAAMVAANRDAPKAGAATAMASESRRLKTPQQSADRPAAAAPGVEVTIRLAPELAEKLSPNDMLFVFALPAEGSTHPLAIIRRQAVGFPLRSTLDDSMAVLPSARLSGAERFIVGALVSKSGVATPRSGDLRGFGPTMARGSRSADVVIDSEVR